MAPEKCSSSSDASPVDWISGLPEPIISHILSFLPTKKAVATSILSRDWRFCWTRDASFDLDCRVEGYSAELIDAILRNQSGGSIYKFLLRWGSPDAVCRWAVSGWARIAIARNVRVLHLDTDQLCSDLPSLLYTCGTLQVLTLRGPFRIDPPNANVVRLPNLTNLTLSDVRYGRDESICNLISGCPVLEYLGISRRAHVRDNMVVCSISSPVLKHLDIRFRVTITPENRSDLKLKIDCPSLQSLNLFDCVSNHISIHPQPTSLATVYLGGDFPNMSILAELMQALCYAKLLTLCLDLGPIERARLPVSFQRLAKLEIRSLKWMIRRSSLMYFLNGCSKLEELVIHDARRWYEEDCAPRCLLPGIRRLRIKGFRGLEQKMAILSFFLEHGLVMETVYISCIGDDEKRLQVVNRMSRFPRASPTCQICLVDGRGRILNRF